MSSRARQAVRKTRLFQRHDHESHHLQDLILALADRHTDRGCYPGMKWLAEQARFTIRTTISLIQRAELLGALTKASRASPLGTNVYRLAGVDYPDDVQGSNTQAAPLDVQQPGITPAPLDVQQTAAGRASNEEGCASNGGGMCNSQVQMVHITKEETKKETKDGKDSDKVMPPTNPSSPTSKRGLKQAMAAGSFEILWEDVDAVLQLADTGGGHKFICPLCRKDLLVDPKQDYDGDPADPDAWPVMLTCLGGCDWATVRDEIRRLRDTGQTLLTSANKKVVKEAEEEPFPP